MKYTCLLMAAGSGARAGLGYNKVLYKMKNGKTVLENAACNFINDDDCEKIVIVTKDELVLKIDFNSSKIVFTSGGLRRMDSVANGLKKVDSEYVLIHDGARPFLIAEHLEKLKQTVVTKSACILAVKAKDTIKFVDEQGKIVKTLNRDYIYHAQTPQAFKTELIKEAYKNADFEASDESVLLEKMGIDVFVVEGDHKNFKITFPEDLD